MRLTFYGVEAALLAVARELKNVVDARIVEPLGFRLSETAVWTFD
jgi:hypothetical protein